MAADRVLHEPSMSRRRWAAVTTPRRQMRDDVGDARSVRRRRHLLRLQPLVGCSRPTATAEEALRFANHCRVAARFRHDASGSIADITLSLGRVARF